MAFQKKYYFYFRDRKNFIYTCELWQNTGSTLTSVEIRATNPYFVVSYPEISNKFEPVRGSGCQINLLSDTNMKFLNLYTSDMQEYMIKLYQGSNLIWCGYLDSEIYEESLRFTKNYSVSISGNDGFALLDRMYYLDDSGNHYTGITSQFSILQKIFSSINLPYNNVYIQIGTSISGITLSAGETIFHKTYVINDNFYNEDGDPETLRTVLESILQPYGAFIIQDSGSVFITDITSILSGTTFSFLKYSGNTLSYIGTDNTDNTLLGDLSTIKFANSEQRLTIVPGINKQIVKYSPYKNNTLINSEDYIFSGFYTGVTTGSTGFQWKEDLYLESDGFELWPYHYFTKMYGIDEINKDISDSYLLFKGESSINQSYYEPADVGYLRGLTSFRSKSIIKPISKDQYGTPTHIPSSDNTIISNSNYGLKINMKIYPRFLNDLNNKSETSNKNIKRIILNCDIIIGNKCLYYVDYYIPSFSKNQWVNTTINESGYPINGGSLGVNNRTGFTTLNFYNGSVSSVVPELGNLSDVWTDLKKYKYIWNGTDYTTESYDLIIPLESYPSGNFYFKIYGYSCYSAHQENGIWYYDYEYCNSLRIKDIKITIVDSLRNEVQKIDVEYEGFLDKNLKNEGDKIDLLLGTNDNKFPIERGGLIYLSGSTYSFIEKWTRNGTTDTIENLLLRSIVGNYNGKSNKLSCTTNKVGVLGYITYNNYLSGKKFIPTSINIDYAENSSELILEEIFQDSLTIKKSW